MRRSAPFWAIALLIIIFPATGCVLRTRPVEDRYSTVSLKDSTQQQLIAAINYEAEAIQSLKATVDIDTSAGGMKKGQTTDYKEIRGFVLARKPDSLHMTGLMPFVRTTAFDMVSDGQDFKLWIPSKNKFVIGKNEVTVPNVDQPMENVRPQNIYEAMLIRRIEPFPTEIAVMGNGYETLHDAKGHRILQPDYELTVIRKRNSSPDSDYVLSRKIIFGRTDLKPHRQYIYNDQAEVATDARYAEYKDYNGFNFPSRIEINRPQEEYDITLNMLKLEINTPLRDDQFVLEQPAGAQVVHLDRPQSSRVLPVDQRP
jgi:Domain of unknown function (DUF4292)